MQSIEFRLATLQDAEIVAEIRRKTFYDTFHADNIREDMELFLEENFNIEKTTQELSDPTNTFLFAYSKDQLSGFVKLAETETPEQLKNLKSLEIASIYTIKEKIGQGIGAALMQRSIEIARERNKQVIWLGVWEKNERAITFYKRWGFQKFDEHVFMVGRDEQNDWLLQKTL